MARERTTTVRCAEDGCQDTTFYTYANQREYAEIRRRQATSPYKCTRHARPDEVLRPDNPQTETVLIASRVPSGSRYSDKKWLDGLFWLPEGREQGGSGICHGPGFIAHASDLPEGARLIVTARLELPSEQDGDGHGGT